MRQRGFAEYRRVLSYFVTYLRFLQLNPEYGFQFDDLLMEYKSGTDLPPWLDRPTKSVFTKTISALEKMCPWLKGELIISRAALHAWGVSWRPHHALPMLTRWQVVSAAGLLRHRGRPKIAAVLLLQGGHGLRPGEGLALHGRDLILPEEAPELKGQGLLTLGMRAGTKAKREQSTAVSHPFYLELMRALRACSSMDERLIDLSLGSYSDAIAEGCALEGIPAVGFTGHSPRAGFATGLFLAEGVDSLPRIQHICRWQNPKMLKIYLDVVAVATSHLSRELTPKLPTARACAQWLPRALLMGLYTLANVDLSTISIDERALCIPGTE